MNKKKLALAFLSALASLVGAAALATLVTSHPETGLMVLKGLGFTVLTVLLTGLFYQLYKQ